MILTLGVLVERDRVRPVVEEPNHELLALAHKLNLNHWCRHCSAKFNVKMQLDEYHKRCIFAVPLAEHGIELRWGDVFPAERNLFLDFLQLQIDYRASLKL
jgi:hypothetical protein